MTAAACFCRCSVRAGCMEQLHCCRPFRSPGSYNGMGLRVSVGFAAWGLGGACKQPVLALQRLVGIPLAASSLDSVAPTGPSAPGLAIQPCSMHTPNLYAGVCRGPLGKLLQRAVAVLDELDCLAAALIRAGASTAGQAFSSLGCEAPGHGGFWWPQSPVLRP